MDNEVDGDVMRLLKLRFYYLFYKVLILLVFLLGGKFAYDFYVMNVSVNDSNCEEDIKYEKIVIMPRVQVQAKNFEYTKADRGYLGGPDYFFENVDMTGDLGDITAGKLDVIDSKNVLIFTEKPSFTIYLNELE